MSESGMRLGRGESGYPLPEDWDVGPLGRVLTTIDAGRSPDLPDRPAQAGEWGVLKVSAIRPDGLEEIENKAVIQPSLIDRNIEVRHGDLLISRANTPALIGLACHVRNPRSGLMLSDKTLRLNIDSKFALPEFISYLLQASFSRRQIEICGTGSSGSMKNISQDEIRAFTLPLPKIQEQFKIANILGAADEAIRSAGRLITKLEQVRQGLFHALLEPRTLLDGMSGLEWKTGTLGDFLECIEAGWSPACEDVPPVYGQWGVLKVNAISGGFFVPTASKSLPKALRPRADLEVQSGDVLLARANGVVELVATAVEVDSTPPCLMLSDKTLRLTPKHGDLTRSYLALLLNSLGVRRQVLQLKRKQWTEEYIPTTASWDCCRDSFKRRTRSRDLNLEGIYSSRQH